MQYSGNTGRVSPTQRAANLGRKAVICSSLSQIERHAAAADPRASARLYGVRLAPATYLVGGPAVDTAVAVAIKDGGGDRHRHRAGPPKSP